MYQYSFWRFESGCALLRRGLLLVGLAGLLGACGPRWEDYDEAGHLALVAEHESVQMRFALLNSQVRDKNRIWRGLGGDLRGFGARYEELKPRLLEAQIADIQAMVAAGELSYEELTKFYLYRIRALETDHDLYLNAIIALNPDAIADARRADKDRAAAAHGGAADQSAGSNTGSDSVNANNSPISSPLHGIPVLLKDNIGMAGLPTTAGAIALDRNFTADAFIVQRLRAAGAIILGKANLSEWAYFFCDDCPSGYSAIGGQTMNPYGRFRFSPGGSSSGSGAAIAAGYAVIAVGTETSGSILSPSSANSLVGLKPTTGSLSRSGIVPISATLDTAGPMGRSVADVVLMFNAMAGYDEADTAMPALADGMQLEYPAALAVRTISNEAEAQALQARAREMLQGKRLGAPVAYMDDGLFSTTVNRLSNAGATVLQLEIPEFDTDDFESLLGGDMVRDLAAYLNQWTAEDVEVNSIADIRSFNNADPALRAPYGQARLDAADALQLSPEQLQAITSTMQQAARTLLSDLFSTNQLDALLSINNFGASLAALANYPALTVPMGYTDEGRPMNLTFIAPSFSEQDLIDIAAAYEKMSQARRLPQNYR